MEDPKAAMPLPETRVPLFFLKKSYQKRRFCWLKYEVRNEWIKNINSNSKALLSSQKNCAQMPLKPVDVLIKIIQEIQRQIRQTLQVFEGISQSSEPLI